MLKGSEEEFLAELAVLKRLNHPNIVRFLGVYESKQKDLFLITGILSFKLKIQNTCPRDLYWIFFKERKRFREKKCSICNFQVEIQH
jgi:hypothetical protein